MFTKLKFKPRNKITFLGQVAQGGGIKVKISDMPFPVPNAQQLNQIVWTMLGTATKVIYKDFRQTFYTN